MFKYIFTPLHSELDNSTVQYGKNDCKFSFLIKEEM